MKVTEDRYTKLNLAAIRGILDDETRTPIFKFRAIKDICESALASLFVKQRKVTGSQKKDTI
jgi:hypothetical protein